MIYPTGPAAAVSEVVRTALAAAAPVPAAVVECPVWAVPAVAAAALAAVRAVEECLAAEAEVDDVDRRGGL